MKTISSDEKFVRKNAEYGTENTDLNNVVLLIDVKRTSTSGRLLELYLDMNHLLCSPFHNKGIV